MKINQYYYMREVLGITSVIPPAFARCYRLHHQTRNPAILFFCSEWEPTVIYNINKALGDKMSMAAEITDLSADYTGQVLHNLTRRFSPAQGIVIFGREVAYSLLKKSELLSINPPVSYNIVPGLAGCILNPLSEFTRAHAAAHSDSSLTQKKTHAWQVLKKAFMVSS